jgi:hypothetical protein
MCIDICLLDSNYLENTNYVTPVFFNFIIERIHVMMPSLALDRLAPREVTKTK